MRPALRTRNKLKLSRKTPGGKSKILIREKQNRKKTLCVTCGRKIFSPQASRKFRGTLCHSCLRHNIKQKVRGA